MAGSGTHSIAIDECMALGYVGEIAQEYHVGFIGNFHITAALFEETEEIAADVQRCLNEGARFPGYVFGLGGPLIRHINPSRLDQTITLFEQTRSRQFPDTLTEEQSTKATSIPEKDER